MSVSSLPEWKQLLLERKRREEEQRERREKEEEEKLASMPAWKRGIIQRRKANETSLSPDPGMWLDAEPKPGSQVSMETIVPVHENPFIRTQSVWRKGKDLEAPNEVEGKLCVRSQEVEVSRGRDIELKIERFRDLSEGWEKEKSREKSLGKEKENNQEGCEKDKKQWKDSNGLGDVGGQERIHPDKNVAPWVDVAGVAKLRLSCKERFGKQRNVKAEDEKVNQKKNDAEMWKKHRSELKKVEPVNKRSAEKVLDTDGDKGFTVASVKNTEGISFARRVPIRQDGRARAERDARRETGSEKDSEADDGLERTVQTETDYVGASLEESPNPSEAPDSQCKPDSAFTECSSLLSMVPDQIPHRGPEWSGTGPQGPYLITQSPDNFLKPTNCAPTPASSPCSPSPASSPSISPSPSASPKLFTIKRATASVARPGTAVPAAASKKYPMVEEIEVIGGYQNLERSCLVKSKVTPKRVSFTYPEKTNWLASRLLCFSFYCVFNSAPVQGGTLFMTHCHKSCGVNSSGVGNLINT
uniref:Phostensin/Taperin PP1-binding domain-containing protein n=1 Tax=Poecilia latipinna TaxID=48699 RepID=A0A3B3U4N8_9TELE